MHSISLCTTIPKHAKMMVDSLDIGEKVTNMIILPPLKTYTVLVLYSIVLLKFCLVCE